MSGNYHEGIADVIIDHSLASEIAERRGRFRDADSLRTGVLHRLRHTFSERGIRTIRYALATDVDLEMTEEIVGLGGYGRTLKWATS